MRRRVMAMLRMRLAGMFAALSMLVGGLIVGSAAPANAGGSTYVIAGWTYTYSECIDLGEEYRAGPWKSYICTWDDEFGLYFLYIK
jgi:hypothetical protein